MTLRRVLALCIMLLMPVSFGFAQAKQSTKKTQAPKVRPAQVVAPEQMRWGTYKQATPAGSKVAILYGNPDAGGGGPFVLRVKASDGASVGPLWHSADLHITVLRGAVVFSEGTTPDERKAQHLGPGTYVEVPKRLRYSVVVKGETEYQLQGNAPLKTFPVAATPPTAAALAAEEKRQKGEFDAAVAAFNKASQANNPAALQASRKEFERIARGGGRYSSAAQGYLTTRFPVEAVQQGPCPVIPALKDRGWVVQTLKPGDVVATGLLDQKLAWTACPAPRFPERAKSSTQRPGTIKMAVTVDEGGNVVNVKLRGGISPPGYYEAAAAAVRLWRTNPPRASGMPVRTEVSLDIPFSQ